MSEPVLARWRKQRDVRCFFRFAKGAAEVVMSVARSRSASVRAGFVAPRTKSDTRRAMLQSRCARRARLSTSRRTPRFARAWLTPLAIVFASLNARAQQFQEVAGACPGPVVWSEAVETFDANGDGRIDILFANGIGFDAPGTPLAPTLLINITPPGGPIAFQDETSLRFPPGFVQQAKGLAVCDVDGDGALDVVFANAFGNQPSLLINDGTGHFTDETAARFPSVLLNSFGVGWGDIDNDGDIDLVFADAGPNTYAAPGGKARLFLNDGTGHFTDASNRLNAANKVGAQNAQMVDIDGDFALDVIVDGKSKFQQLYRNDGTGQFALSTSILPQGSSQTYATNWADLDNDGDIDGFYISLAGLFEGTAQNALIPGGTLAFNGSITTLDAVNGDDDNDLVFLDANDDGLLDVIVGSLTYNQEKLYLNDGTFGASSFTFQPNGFTLISDATLDLAAADFDDDGRCDVVTAQGEAGNFQNRVYRNTGPRDTHAPAIGRVEPTSPHIPLSTIADSGLARRAWIQDGTYKRGRTFVSARLDVTATKDGAVQSFSTPMRDVGGGIQRGVVSPAPAPTGIVGMDVTFTVHAEDRAGNASDSPPATFRVCGAENYGVAAPNSVGGGAHIFGENDPSLGANQFIVSVEGLPPGVTGLLFMGTQRVAGAPFGNGLRWVDGHEDHLSIVAANGHGAAVIALDFNMGPLSNVMAGNTRYLQFEYRDPAAGGAGFNATDALEVVFCD